MATLITDMGVLGAGLAINICEAVSRDNPQTSSIRSNKPNGLAV